MATFAEFKMLKPVACSVSPRTIDDVLMTTFGIGDEWEMVARRTLLAAKGDVGSKPQLVRFAIHSDALLSLHSWVLAETIARGDELRTARLERLARSLAGSLNAYASHPWFAGRVLPGVSEQPITGWLRHGLVGPWNMTPDNTPVILRPCAAKAADGTNVTAFTVETVDDG